jgi:hypothetical protein
MLVNLDDNSTDDVFKASPRPGVTGTLGVLNGGTGATTPAAARANLEITPANIGAVAKSGDEMTGALTVNGDAGGIFLYGGVSGGNPGMRFKSSGEDIATIYGLASDRHMLFRLHVPSSNAYEDYNLPAPTAAGSYQILTTKDPVRAADINVTRVSKDSRTLPGLNAFRVEEYAAGENYDLPTNDWYYIFSMQGADTRFGAQLALGMTTTGAYYRPYIAGTWGAWQPLMNVKPSVQDVTATTDSNGNISLGLSEYSYIVVAVKVPSLIATPWVSNADHNWHARIIGVNGNAVTDTSVTVTVYYQAV